MTYTDTGKVSPETQSAIEQEVRTLLRVRVFPTPLSYFTILPYFTYFIHTIHKQVN